MVQFFFGKLLVMSIFFCRRFVMNLQLNLIGVGLFCLYMGRCRQNLGQTHIDLSLSHVIISSDCKGVVNYIKEGTGGQYESIIKEIIVTSRQFVRCSFIFEGRDTNIEAHGLAKHAL